MDNATSQYDRHGQRHITYDTVMDNATSHKSPLDEINEIRRIAADSLWVGT